jgi:hypothetical protein
MHQHKKQFGTSGTGIPVDLLTVFKIDKYLVLSNIIKFIPVQTRSTSTDSTNTHISMAPVGTTT